MSEILHRAIAEIGPRAYSPKQIAAWRSRHSGAEGYRERVGAGDAIMVAVDRLDRPVGYLLLQTDGHLDHLYLHPDHTRRGLAERLLDTAETFARDGGIKRLFSEASGLARPAFERAGYTPRPPRLRARRIHDDAPPRLLGRRSGNP